MVTITNRTKISDIIKANPDSINVMAALAKPFEKLKNPLLRKIMAPRVTLAEAAAIGGCDLKLLRQALLPLGFRFADDPRYTENVTSNVKPQWLLAVPQDKVFIFDVRPLLQGGEDPLKAIVKKFNALRDGEALCIINSFVPYPLINLLAKEALTFTLEHKPVEHHTWFLKRTRDADPQTKKTVEGKLMMDDEKSFADALARFDEPMVRRIDVRHLQMPAPMQTILDALAALPMTHALYVYHKKAPVYLLEELSAERFTIRVLNLGEGEVRLLIYDKEY